MKNSFIISGTDTGIGKTYITSQLVSSYKKNNTSVTALKPIACGVESYPNGTFNEDAYLFKKINSKNMPYSDINPYLLQMPVSPHIAANKENRDIDCLQIKNKIQSIKISTDILLIEGVGGLLVPINKTEKFIDLCAYFAMPLIMVVGIRLGCINHALLSAMAIKQHKINCVGWYANCLDAEMLCQKENIQTIETAYQEILSTQLLGTIPRNPDADFILPLPSKSV